MRKVVEILKEKRRYGVAAAANSPLGVTEEELLFQEFRMWQEVAVNESRRGAGLQVHTQWDSCAEEMLEEETELVSLGKACVLSHRLQTPRVLWVLVEKQKSKKRFERPQ